MKLMWLIQNSRSMKFRRPIFPSYSWADLESEAFNYNNKILIIDLRLFHWMCCLWTNVRKGFRTYLFIIYITNVLIGEMNRICLYCNGLNEPLGYVLFGWKNRFTTFRRAFRTTLKLPFRRNYNISPFSDKYSKIEFQFSNNIMNWMLWIFFFLWHFPIKSVYLCLYLKRFQSFCNFFFMSSNDSWSTLCRAIWGRIFI